MLNSVGLQNPGVDYFLEKELPRLLEKEICVIANISGANVDEYCTIMERLEPSGVAAVELNLSCPNVKEGGIAFGLNPNSVYDVTRRVKECGDKPVIVKLSPNVTDIVEIARAAKEGGGDAVSLINTLLAMEIDIWSRKPVLGNVYGGLSGPAVKPVALRMVHQVAGALDIPVIGIGGILDWQDAVQFLLAGAKAVAIGTANFVNPLAPIEIIEGIEEYARQQGFLAVEDMVGALQQ
jgi:dihydroorotate dehydrogenase (NAD+) catalytic subunit